MFRETSPARDDTEAAGNSAGEASREGVSTLTDREKETLRLLLSGYDAKLIAHELGLSVHTINERLRDARRKLDVSSSREAARRLAQFEQRDPNSFVDMRLGVGGRPVEKEDQGRGGVRFAWPNAGVLMLAFIVAGAAVWFASSATLGAEVHAASRDTPAAITSPPADQVALEWLRLDDRRLWAECWREASARVKSAVSEAGFVSAAQNVREPLGSVSSRKLVSVSPFGSAPGLPQGEYMNVVFRTDFERKKGTTETVALALEGSDWRVIGYHIL